MHDYRIELVVDGHWINWNFTEITSFKQLLLSNANGFKQLSGKGKYKIVFSTFYVRGGSSIHDAELEVKSISENMLKITITRQRHGLEHIFRLPKQYEFSYKIPVIPPEIIDILFD